MTMSPQQQRLARVWLRLDSFGCRMLVVGLLVHLTLVFAVFDVYYRSPIVANLTAHRPSAQHVASDRVVLVTVDGMRAHTFYEHLTEQAPFLLSLIESSASWGVSHTHVPTESRPGHVAIAAGFYEDVSAITKGWKENAVEYDSVFNRSAFSFGIGSPDIVPLFTRGGHRARTWEAMYPAELEDFAADDASFLDDWVFERAKELFAAAATNASLDGRLRSRQVILFLHLLGADTNGHGHKPHSTQYTHNIGVVDRGLRTLASRVAEFYAHDNRTTFIVTADHGMTDWGSHGAGSEHETATPFVAWGAGIRPRPLKRADPYDTPHWWLHADERVDLKQIDMAPLIACLLGTAIPVHSLGAVPLSVVAAPARAKASMALANLRQLKQQMLAVRERKRNGLFLSRRRFVEFPGLTLEKLSSIEQTIAGLAEAGRFEAASALCLQTLPLLVSGVMYYHRYERLSQTLAIAVIFVCWIALLGSFTVRHHIRMPPFEVVPVARVRLLLAAICALVYLNSMDAPNYVYYTLPVYLLSLTRLPSSSSVGLSLLRRAATSIAAVALFSAVFHYRCVLSVLFVVLAAWQQQPAALAGTGGRLRWLWLLVCLAAAALPLAPTTGQFNCVWLNPLCSSVLACALYYVSRLHATNSVRHQPDRAWLHALARPAAVAGHAVLIALVVVLVSDVFGPNVVCQLVAWLLLLGSLPTALLLSAQQPLLHRVLCLSAGLYVPYSLLSASYECVFYVILIALLLLWWYLQSINDAETSAGSSWRRLATFRTATAKLNAAALELPQTGDTAAPGSNDHQLQVLRAQLPVCLLLLLFAFFGVGNLASLNSFDPSHLRCLLTVFQPWLMGVLLLVKVVLPVLVVSVFVCAVQLSVWHASLTHITLALMQYTDAMALVCFVQLRDEGSWADIGMSIGHYLCAMGMAVVFAALLTVARMLLTANIGPRL